MPVLGFQRVLIRYQGLDDKLNVGEHLLSYGADDSNAIYFLHLFEIQEAQQGFYFRGKSEETGLYLVSRIEYTECGLSQEAVLETQGQVHVVGFFRGNVKKHGHKMGLYNGSDK